jgi:hypothetical protein
MNKPLYILFSVIFIQSCASNYSLQDISNSKYHKKSTYEAALICEEIKWGKISEEAEWSKISEEAEWSKISEESDFCGKDGFVDSFSNTQSSEVKVSINITKESHLNSVSPGMILFLGLIPASFFYHYEVNAVSTKDDLVSEKLSKKYIIVQTWGTFNTFKAIFGLNTTLHETTALIANDIEEQLDL